MPNRRKVRVGVVGHSSINGMLDIFLGVLSYKSQVSHWQLVGVEEYPFYMQEETIDTSSVDGLIGYFYSRQCCDILSKAGIPTVSLATRYQDQPFPRVACDEELVGRMGAEHLLSCGFIHFGFFDLFGGWTGKLRLAGFKDVIENRAGRSCHTFGKNDKTSDLAGAIGAWLDGLPKPIAIMGMDDFCGHKLIHQAISKGLRVPEDVAVLGVNNASWLTELAPVPMSSIEMNIKEIGYQAAKMLDAMFAGNLAQTTHWIPPVGVVIRRSTDVMISGDPIISKALTFIREHCHEGISVEDVVNALHVSRRTLEVHLKRMTGQTPQTAIFRAQINRAKKMLVETGDKIWKIAHECGFDSETRFFIVFKRETGMTPSQYRQQN